MIKNTFTLKSLKSKCLTGKLSVPADKSISIRALLISSICFGNTRISNLLESEDVKNTLNCLKKIGVKILKKSNINYIEASTLEDAANKAVKALGDK